MTKVSFRLSVLVAGTGILFLIPARYMQWFPYSKLLTIHITLAIILAVLLIRVFYTHVPKELSNPFKRGIKKWNGAKYLFYLLLVFGSGILLLFQSVFFVTWIMYFHLFFGIWCLLVGLKHTR